MRMISCCGVCPAKSVKTFCRPRRAPGPRDGHVVFVEGEVVAVVEVNGKLVAHERADHGPLTRRGDDVGQGAGARDLGAQLAGGEHAPH